MAPQLQLPSDLTHVFSPLQALLITGPTILLGLYYLRRASKESRFVLITFLVSVVYGLTIELLDIRSTESYFYTDLLFMVGKSPNWVPFSVGISWASILYIVMHTSDRLKLPLMMRPFYDGAMALSVDLVMDPVASASVWVPKTGSSCAAVTTPTFGGIGMWTWCVPENILARWYNVPLGNFVGWFLVVACMSALLRFVRGRLGGEHRSWPVQTGMIAGAAAAATAAVLGLMTVFTASTHSATAQWTVLIALFLLPVMMIVLNARRLDFSNPLDKGLLLLPGLILVSETVTFLRRGIDREHWPLSAALMVGCAVLSALLLLLPSIRRLLPSRRAMPLPASPT